MKALKPAISDLKSAITYLVKKFNSKISKFLPSDHPPGQIFHDSSLYYEKINGIYLRRAARLLLKHTPDWPISQIISFVEYTYLNIPDRSLQMTSIFYMMYHFHDIADDTSNLNLFKAWIVRNIFDKDALVDFSEYCLMPLINEKENWISLIID